MGTYKNTYRSVLLLIITLTLTVILVDFVTGSLTTASFPLSILRIALLVLLIVGELYFFVFRPRAKADASLNEMEENHINLIEGMKEGFSLHEVIFDKDGKAIDYRFLETNKEFEEQTGLHDVQGKLRSEIGVEVVQKWIDIYGRVATTGVPELIKEDIKSSGRYYDTLIYRTGNPERRRVAAIQNDITWRKESEKIKTHLSAIVRNSQESIISVDLQGMIQTWNTGAKNIYGYSAEEAIGKHISMLIPRDKAEEAIGISSKILKGENIDNYESLCLHKSGKVLPVSITISPIKDEEGKIIGMSKISHDISEQKKAEEALIESERRWVTTLASISEGVIATDNQGKITFVNAEAENLTGWNRQDIISQPVQNIFKVIDERTHQEIENPVEKAIREGTTMYLSNHELLVRKDGQEVAVEESVAPIKSSDGRTTGTVVIFHDITERKNAELRLKNYNSDLEQMVTARTAELKAAKEEAESADQQKTNFLMTMSHELRTPLNSIIGFSSILLQGMAGPLSEEQKKQIEMVRTSGHQLLRLVNDILDMSRIEKGKMNIHYETFNILETIEKVIEAEKLFAVNKGLLINLQRERREIQIESDSERVHQILLNIVHNALKFTEKGSVTIECHCHHEMVEINITDTGIGIAKENLGKLFNSFVQLDNILVKRNEGTGSGLGLAISKKLLDLLNGRISVKSEYGSGSTFTVYLPFKRRKIIGI